MPKLNRLRIRIETGDPGTPGPVHFNINGHRVPFENVKGGTGPGDVFEGEFEVNSFAHSLALGGPDKGRWHIRNIAVDYHCENVPPYTVKFGEVTLDEATDVNILQEAPLPVFDV